MWLLFNRMKIVFLVALLLQFPVVISAPLPHSRTDHQNIMGEWQVEKIIIRGYDLGQKHPEIQKIKVTIDDKSFRMHSTLSYHIARVEFDNSPIIRIFSEVSINENEQTCQYAIWPEKQPKQFNYVYNTKQEKFTRGALYILDRDSLKLCRYLNETSTYPHEFISDSADNSTEIYEFKRIKK